jgi:hypothetical protein
MACSGTAYHSYFVSVRFSVRVVPWFRRLIAGFSPRRTGFAPVSVHLGFVVDKVTMGQVFFRVLHVLISSGVWKICGRNSETQSRPLVVHEQHKQRGPETNSRPGYRLGFQYFPQSVQENAGIVRAIRSDPFQVIHQSSSHSTFKAMSKDI